LIFLLATVAAVLLIICANLVSLLLARVPGRMREAAIRTALDATPGRIVLAISPTGVAFPRINKVGILIPRDFAARYPPCVCPCQQFAPSLSTDHA